MKKLIQFVLSDSEISQVQFSIRKISDRQYADHGVRDLLELGCWLAGSRNDMFWIECHLDGEDLGALCVIPDLFLETYYIVQNWSQVQDWKRLKKYADRFFRSSDAFGQQWEWMNIINQRVERFFGNWNNYSRQSCVRKQEFMREKLTAIQQHQPLFEEYQTATKERKREIARYLETGPMAHLKRTVGVISGFEHWNYLYNK